MTPFFESNILTLLSTQVVISSSSLLTFEALDQVIVSPDAPDLRNPPLRDEPVDDVLLLTILVLDGQFPDQLF